MTGNRMTGSHQLRRSRPAYTYLELTLTILILSIAAAVAGPRFADALAFHQVEQSALRIAADLELAQASARLQSQTVTVDFDTLNHTYGIDRVVGLNRSSGATFVQLDEGSMACQLVSAQFGGDARVIFNGHGIPDSGGQVVIVVGGRTKTVQLAANTGKVTLP